MDRRGFVTGSMAAVALLASGCRRETEAGPATDPQRPLRLGIDRWPGYYPAALADALGYFGAAGLQVEIVLPDDTDRMLAEFAAGQYDLIGVALGDLITLTRNRQDVAVVLVSDQSDGGDALLARPGYTLPGEGPLRIGTNLGGFGELFVRELLPRIGVSPHRVEWTNADASEVPALLADAALDLGHCWEPYASEAEARGAVRIGSSADTPGLIPDVIAGTRHLAEQRGDALRAFAAAWFRAVDHWRAHPQDAAAAIERRLQLPPGSASLSGIALQDLAANRQLLLEAGLQPVIDRYSMFFVERGRLLEPVDAPAMVLTRHLQ